MRQGITVQVSEGDHVRLAAIVADRNSPEKHVWRARIVLMTADGVIMRQTGKIANPGARPHPARFADEEGPLRDNDARLQAPWHHHLVCRAQRLGRPDHWPLHAAPSPSGFHSLSQYDRSRHPRRQDHPYRPRQLRHAQARQGACLARPTTPALSSITPRPRPLGSMRSRVSSPN